MEFKQLKDIATKVGYKYHHTTGASKLEIGLRQYCIEVGTTLEEVAKDMGIEQLDDIESNIELELPSKETSSEMVQRLSKMTFAQAEKDVVKKESNERLKDAMKLVRCIITCNNKNKTSYTGEIFCVRNAVLPEVKKFIPFGVSTHIPNILLNMVKEKQYQQFKAKKINGNEFKDSYMVAEYNIQLLDPITTDEFNAIRQKQLAEGFNGE